MPAETRHYVPKLQALKNIFSNAVLMSQLGLPEIINRPYFATIGTPRAMDVKTAARLANMPVDEFLALNPAHNRPVMKADTPLVLLAEKLATFQSNLERNAAPLTEWQAYTLKSGEKLDQVAPRLGITLADLMRANGLSGKIRLAGGSTLLVPAGDGAQNLESISAEPRLPQIIEPEPPAKAAKTPPPVAKASDKHSGKADKATQAKPGDTKLATKDARKPEAKAAKPAAGSATRAVAAKPAPAPAKVAKSSNGRRI